MGRIRLRRKEGTKGQKKQLDEKFVMGGNGGEIRNV